VKIVTNQEGVNGYLALNRSATTGSARRRARTDAGWGTDDASFNNIEIIDVEELDAATRRPSPPVSRRSTGSPGLPLPGVPRDTFMEEVGPAARLDNQPFSWAVYKNTYYNLFCRSRRRQGMVAPTA
jgi:hypothetical protein